YPNVEAASSFARNIWPRLRDTLPESRLMIVGANPTPQVRALRDIAGVTVTGTVPDVRPYYRDALAAIVPLRTGGGTRLKILEAMAAGVPVVSTPLGAEGLAVTSDRDILLVEPDDAAGWARHLSQLAQPSARRAEIVSQALELVRARYDWNTLGQKLWDTYAGWMGSGG
ncbi:MAG TPA: glycosyltransferase, partial [Bryobacteraceae bacterium]|nr:glycosyltransferase [Bryobacteraceae bacterium]